MRFILKVVVCGFLLGNPVPALADTEAEITSHIKAGFELTSQKDHEKALVEFLYAAAGAHAGAGWALYGLQRFSEAALEFEMTRSLLLSYGCFAPERRHSPLPS